MTNCAYPKCGNNARDNILYCSNCKENLKDIHLRGDLDYTNSGDYIFPPTDKVGADVDCPKCGGSLRTINSKYCSDKCAKLTYVYNRYRRDPNYKKKMKASSKKYGRSICPKCGGKKDRYAQFCGECVGLVERFFDVSADKLDKMRESIDTQLDDEESIFRNPKNMMEHQIFGIIKGEHGISLEEVFEIMMHCDYAEIFDKATIRASVEKTWAEVKDDVK